MTCKGCHTTSSWHQKQSGYFNFLNNNIIWWLTRRSLVTYTTSLIAPGLIGKPSILITLTVVSRLPYLHHYFLHQTQFLGVAQTRFQRPRFSVCWCSLWWVGSTTIGPASKKIVDNDEPLSSTVMISPASHMGTTSQNVACIIFDSTKCLSRYYIYGVSSVYYHVEYIIETAHRSVTSPFLSTTLHLALQ